MKKTLLRASLFIGLIALIPSCELLEECKSCTLVTESDGVKNYGSSGTYCGTELAEKEAESVTIGNTTTYYECE
jgi:hypothetical protein